ncbi:hypothetical protein G7046_g9308 [Stylonectria norvegica]|nr:hypothetical protein G7046_g9308 [Stylonectria norvegica]
MRLGWYAGVSTGLAASVVLSAFHQRANFYSAMVYLAQSNFCLLVLVNFTFIVYSSFVYGLTRIFYGRLRAVEVEQLTERAWFAITETCLAMTIFREEIGAWFIVMFTALVTGKVWGWIGDGRVEILEQQPPANPRLFHLRLSASLSMSFIYDIFILRYAIKTVIQQARPNMMVMFLFEFAILATSSWRTAARYALSITEQNIQESQKRKRLAQLRTEVRERREVVIGQREAAAAAGEEVPDDALPSEDDIDEMDIEVPGWSSKGEWVLWLDLLTDMIKLGIYVAFFFMLLTFYGLPIHIMRDLFMTSRDFVKRLSALLRYRRAIQEMNRYPDATQEELTREDTCIICREEMRPWDAANAPDAIDRVRPKKLPCGHILHLGCLKSWLERQQVCPTCRSPVTGDNARAAQARAAGLRIEIGGRPRAPGQQPPGNGGDAPAQGQEDNAGARPNGRRRRGPRIFQLGPIQFGFGANGQQVRELAQQFGMPQGGHNQEAPPAAPPAAPQVAPQMSLPAPSHPMTGANIQNLRNLLNQVDTTVQREVQMLQNTQQELQTVHLLMAELARLRQRHDQQEQAQSGLGQGQGSPGTIPGFPIQQPQLQPQPQPMPQPYHFQLPPQVALGPANNMPPYPGRNPSPAVVARHGAPINATAIPAGSSELPEGVVLPAGWSLLPLQRLDGPPGSTVPSPQTAPQVGIQTGLPAGTQAGSRAGTLPGTQATSGESSVVNEPTQTTAQPGLNDGGNNVLQSTEISSAATTTENSQATLQAETPQSTRTVEPTPVVAPSPILPNWGGSAQLFANGTRLEQGETPAQTHAPATVEGNSSTHQATMQAEPVVEPIVEPQTREDSSEESDSSDDSVDEAPAKGKGKAVTVEDAEDEDEVAEDEDEDDESDE